MNDYIKSSLLFQNMEQEALSNMVDSTLQDLVDSNLIKSTDEEVFEPTQLGRATVASAFSPEDGLFIHDEIKRALQAFVMDGDMHIFYMFAPIQATVDIDWMIFRDEILNLDESGLRALQFVEVNLSFVNSM